MYGRVVGPLSVGSRQAVLDKPKWEAWENLHVPLQHFAPLFTS